MNNNTQITTLTLNPAIDFTLYLDEKQNGGALIAGTLHRTAKSVLSQGGKGTNVSLALHALGVSSNAVVLLGGGNGRRFAEVHTSRGLTLNEIPIAAETRMNVKVIDAAGGGTEFNQSAEVTEDELAAAEAELDKTVTAGGILVMSGSLPKGAAKDIYAKLCKKYRDAGAYVVVDCDGEALKNCLEGDIPPSLIKPNEYELNLYTGADAHTISDIVTVCQKINKKTGVDILCTLDSRGAVIVTGDTAAYCPAPRVTLRGFTGAGDTALAAYLYMTKLCGKSQLDGLRFAVSASAAKVELEGTEIPTAELMGKFMTERYYNKTKEL